MTWRDRHRSEIEQLAPSGEGNTSSSALMRVRGDLLSSFGEAIRLAGVLNAYKTAGVVASWWAHVEVDLRVLAANGFGGLVDGWLRSITDSLAPEENREEEGASAPKARVTFDPLDHRLVGKLLPEFRGRLAEAESAVAEVQARLDELEREAAGSDEGEDGEEVGGSTVLRDDERRFRKLEREVNRAGSRLSKMRQQLQTMQNGKGRGRRVELTATGACWRSFSKTAFQTSATPPKPLHF